MNATTNLEVIYDAMTVWLTELDGATSIQVELSELGLGIKVLFHTESSIPENKDATCVIFISREQIEQVVDSESLEKWFLDKIKSAHSLWEVGEE